MREYKFRAWDKLKKVMVTRENVDELIDKFDNWADGNDPYLRDEWYPAYDIKVIFGYFDKIQHYNPFTDDGDMKDRFEIMQYTRTKR